MGDTGEWAELLEALLLPHLEKKRADVLRPFDLLSPLARGEISSEMRLWNLELHCVSGRNAIVAKESLLSGHRSRTPDFNFADERTP